jgi:hypothetical protein
MIGIEKNTTKKGKKGEASTAPINWRDYGFLSHFFTPRTLDEWYAFPVAENKVKGFVRNAQNNFRDDNIFEYVEKRGPQAFLCREEETRLILKLNEKQSSCPKLLSQKAVCEVFESFWENELRSKTYLLKK